MLNNNDFIRNNRNYIIIALLSVAAVFFLPMLGSSLGLALNIPNTVAGWIVYLITKFCIVVINIMIFDQFMKRAKVNAAQDPLFQKAEAIFLSMLPQTIEDTPLPAEVYIQKLYKNKVISTAIFTILGVFGFTNAILTFDWVSMLSYVFTITMGLVFGWAAMIDAEQIWKEKHYKYAIHQQKMLEEKEKQKLCAPPLEPEAAEKGENL
jgi:hypothetical protein